MHLIYSKVLIFRNSRKLNGCKEPPRLNAYSGPNVCRRDLIVGSCEVIETGLITGVKTVADNVEVFNVNVKGNLAYCYHKLDGR